MIFKVDVPLPSNTPILTPIDITMVLTSGMVKKIGVYFPWGCAGLAGIQVIRRTWQLAPITRGEWLASNELLLTNSYNFNLNVEPYELIIRGYNIDDTYDHTPFVIVEIIRDARTIALDRLLSEL